VLYFAVIQTSSAAGGFADADVRTVINASIKTASATVEMTAEYYFPRNSLTSVVRIIYLFIYLVNISYNYNTVCPVASLGGGADRPG